MNAHELRRIADALERIAAALEAAEARAARAAQLEQAARGIGRVDGQLRDDRIARPAPSDTPAKERAA